MEISPIATYHCPVGGKFGLPRQSGIARGLEGRIVFSPSYRNPDALRGLEGFSRIWLIWEFSLSKKEDGTFHPTVRPPRLGGNERIGVFATRSPFRPNNLGLSCVKVEGIDLDDSEGPVIIVSGGGLMDGTPIYDIKPYIPYADSFPDAEEGFTSREWATLEVEFPEDLKGPFTSSDVGTITALLEQDPRPHYHCDPERTYALTYKGYDILFRVDGKVCRVQGVKKIR